MPIASVMKARAENVERIIGPYLHDRTTAKIESTEDGYRVTATDRHGSPILSQAGEPLLGLIAAETLQKELIAAVIVCVNTRLGELRQAEEAAAKAAERAEFDRMPTRREQARLEEIEATVGYWEKRNADGIAHLADSSRAVNFSGNDVEIVAQVAGRCEVLRWVKPVVDGEYFAEKGTVEKLAIISNRVDSYLSTQVAALRSTAGRNMVDACANEATIEVWRILNDRNLI